MVSKLHLSSYSSWQRHWSAVKTSQVHVVTSDTTNLHSLTAPRQRHSVYLLAARSHCPVSEGVVLFARAETAPYVDMKPSLVHEDN